MIYDCFSARLREFSSQVKVEQTFRGSNCCLKVTSTGGKSLFIPLMSIPTLVGLVFNTHSCRKCPFKMDGFHTDEIFDGRKCLNISLFCIQWSYSIVISSLWATSVCKIFMMFNIVTQPSRVKWQNLNILYHLEIEMECLLICLITFVAWCDFSEWLIVETLQTFQLLLERRRETEGIERAGRLLMKSPRHMCCSMEASGSADVAPC